MTKKKKAKAKKIAKKNNIGIKVLPDMKMTEDIYRKIVAMTDIENMEDTIERVSNAFVQLFNPTTTEDGQLVLALSDIEELPSNLSPLKDQVRQMTKGKTKPFHLPIGGLGPIFAVQDFIENKCKIIMPPTIFVLEVTKRILCKTFKSQTSTKLPEEYRKIFKEQNKRSFYRIITHEFIEKYAPFIDYKRGEFVVDYAKEDSVGFLWNEFIKNIEEQKGTKKGTATVGLYGAEPFILLDEFVKNRGNLEYSLPSDYLLEIACRLFENVPIMNIPESNSDDKTSSREKEDEE